jgi:hypothetical protein
MDGSYSIQDDTLVFRPSFPLSSGVRYRAIFRPPSGPPVEAVFDGPVRSLAPIARVTHIFPSAGVLPANLLKLYIHFSAPMSRSEAWQRIHLIDTGAGKPVELPFLEIEQELWDRDHRRLTVLFDPGRIKRGLVPINEVGPALVKGRKYALVVDASWKDANGAPMIETGRKEFTVGADDRTAVEPKRWKITTPASGTQSPLVIDFGEPLESALAEHSITVDGIEGAVAISKDESRWSFTPSSPWKSGNHRLVVDRALEDLAGNRVGRVFDVDTFGRISKEITQETVSVPFRIR